MIGLLIIPCYNEEAIIEKSIHQISLYLNSIPYNIDILIVDDDSKDRTVKLARECQDLYGGDDYFEQWEDDYGDY